MKPEDKAAMMRLVDEIKAVKTFAELGMAICKKYDLEYGIIADFYTALSCINDELSGVLLSTLKRIEEVDA